MISNFGTIICWNDKSRPGITSLGFYYTVVQKYISLKLIEAWIFPPIFPFYFITFSSYNINFRTFQQEQ